MEITNKNVFISGSTRGIGLAIAHHFAANGANIILNGRSEIAADLLASFDQYGVKVSGVSGDVSDFDDAKRMIDDATTALGSVDILINNAGITADKLMLKICIFSAILINALNFSKLSFVVLLSNNI